MQNPLYLACFLFLQRLLNTLLELIIINKVRSRRSLKGANDDNFKRTNKKYIGFNNHEIQALNKYFKKYKVDNKSKFMRETIMKTVLKKFSDDYPTLWDQPGISLQTSMRF